jgi:hypothetical protein
MFYYKVQNSNVTPHLVQQQLFINNLLPNTILQQLLCFCLTTTCTDIFCQPCDKTKYTSCHSRIYVLTPPTYLDPFCFIWFWDSVIDLDSKNPEIGSFGQRSIWVQQQLVSNKKRPTNRSQLPGHPDLVLTNTTRTGNWSKIKRWLSLQL